MPIPSQEEQGHGSKNRSSERNLTNIHLKDSKDFLPVSPQEEDAVKETPQ